MNDSKRPPFGFETTQWSLVVAAGDQVGANSNQSLQSLCQKYWRPLYVFVRRQHYASHEAEDAVQAFFLHLLSADALRIADPQRGRFRTFLLSSFENFLRNQNRKAKTLKRGGQNVLLSLDIRDAEGSLLNQPVDVATPEAEYDRQWAISVLDEVFSSLKSDYEARDKRSMFDALAPYLSVTGERKAYAETADDLSLTVAAVKVAVHRLRREYRRRLQAVVASTVQSEREIQDELDVLLKALNPPIS